VGYFARSLQFVIPSEHFRRDQRQKAQSRNLLFDWEHSRFKIAHYQALVNPS
jgi:hypothetical protein